MEAAMKVSGASRLVQAGLFMLLGWIALTGLIVGFSWSPASPLLQSAKIMLIINAIFGVAAAMLGFFWALSRRHPDPASIPKP